MMNNVDRKIEFETQGYTIYKNFFSEEEIAPLLKELGSVCSDGKMSLCKENLIFRSNGFRQSPFIQAFISQKKIVDFLFNMIGPNIWVRWDQAVEKRPGGEEFPWHQDSGYATSNETYYQFWIALTDMTRENGGLWLQPGSHKCGRLPHEWIENHLVCTEEVSEPVFIEANKGDIVVFSSFTLHRTLPNISKDSRWAYVVEYMSLDCYDPFIEPPYFIAARDGMPCSEFVRFDRSWWSPKNQLKYSIPIIHSLARKTKVGTLKQLESILKKS